MFNVELYNHTTGTPISHRQAQTEREAAETVRMYERLVKADSEVLSESNYDTFPSGRIRGATLQTEDGEFCISAAKH